VRLSERMIVDDRAGVADGDTVVSPALGGSEDIVRHLLGGHGWGRREF